MYPNKFSTLGSRLDRAIKPLNQSQCAATSGNTPRCRPGVVWEVYKSLPGLLEACRECLSENPLFVVTTVYAVRASAIHIAQAMEDMMDGFGGKIEMGELVTREQSAGRLLSQAVYAKWEGRA